MDQEKIGNFIAKKRKNKNLTQEQLAEKLGITDRAVSNWENGKNMPDLSLFKPLCDELDISINELMSGEEIDENHYIKVLEENIVNMVSNIELKKKKRIKILFILLSILFIIVYSFYHFYEIDIKYDERVIGCNIENDVLSFYIKGQSGWNTNYVIKKIDNEQIYLYHSTINIYNKRKSNWEYSQTMASLLNDNKIPYEYINTIELDDDKIKAYYTDESINKLKNVSDTEIRKIIEESYLMCEN